MVSTISTNGRVEPEVNYELHSPIATTVKAIYVQPGDQVPAGKLLMVLDDMQARAREATAESGVKSAQAALEAATHNGTQQERQMAAADVTRARLERDEARRGLDALTKLQLDRSGVGQRGGCSAAAAGYGRSQSACIGTERAQPLFVRQRWQRARAALCRCRGQSGGSAGGRGTDIRACPGGGNDL